MGYILPIPFEQYDQYHLRGMREDLNPFRTEQIERVSRSALLQFGGGASLRQEYSPFKKKTEISSEKIDAVYGELTGAGLRFNQKI